MADEVASEAKILITTTAAGDGAEKTAAALEKDVAATKQLAAANEELAASGKNMLTASASMDRYAAETIAKLEAQKAALAAMPPQVVDVNAGQLTREQQIAAIDAEILSTRRQIASVAVEQKAAEEGELVSKEQQARLDAEYAAEKEKQLTLTQQRAAMESEVAAILATQKELEIAKAAGNSLAVEKLEAEVAVRKLTVAELKQELSTRAELAAIEDGQAALLTETVETIEARVAARQLELETMEAQEALNAELIAQEEKRLAVEAEADAAASARGPLGMRGMRGMVGSLGEELGLGALGFQLMGIAFLVETIYRGFERHEEQIKKNTEQEIKFRDEVDKERAGLEKIKDLGEVESRREEILGRITELNEKRAGAEGDELRQLNSQVGAQEGLLNQLDAMTPLVMQRAEAERTAKEDLKQQLESIKALPEAYRAATKAAEDYLRTIERIEDIKEGADLANIDRNERDGKISHEEAEGQRVKIKNAAELQKYKDEQIDRDNQIRALQKETNDTAAQAGDKQKTADAAAQKANDALAALNANQALISKGENAEGTINSFVSTPLGRKLTEDFATRGQQESFLQENLYDDSQKGGGAEYQQAISDLETYYQAKKDEEAGFEARKHQKALQDAADEAKTRAGNAQMLADAAKTQADDTAATNATKITDIQGQEQNAAAVQFATTQAQGPEDADKIEQGRLRDKKEKEEANKNAGKGVKQEEKDQQALIEQGRGAAREATGATGGSALKDSQQVRDAANQLARDPLNEQLAQHLKDLIGNLMAHTNSLETARMQALSKTFSDLNKHINDVHTKLQGQIETIKSWHLNNREGGS